MKGSVVLIGACLAMAAGAVAQERPWYVELGGGAGLVATIQQVGFNYDDLCYPTSVECLPHEGYRWYYELPSDAGIAVHGALGRHLGQLRVEASGAYSSRNLGQTFTAITYLDGTVQPSALVGTGVVETVYTGVGSLNALGVRLNVLYAPLRGERTMRPFVGVGAGLSRMTVTGVYFESRFSCESKPCAPGFELYDGLQDEDMSGTNLGLYGYAGFDYLLSDAILAGLRFTAGRSQPFSATGTYIEHPMDRPDVQSRPIHGAFTNETEFSDLFLMSVVATVRYNLDF